MERPALLAAAMLWAVNTACSAQDVNSLHQHQSLRFDLGSGTQLLLQPPQRPAVSASALASLQPPRARETAVGVELKLRPSSSSSRELKQLLRLQLSQRSALQFRPRSGGLAITYREQF